MLWIWLFAEVLSGSVWPIYDLRLHDESVWLVCVTNVMNLAVCRGPIGVCVTNLWLTSAWRVCVTSLCDKCYASGCVPKSNRGLWPILYYSFSRVLLSELCLKIWFTWRVCVTSLYDKCYECILVPVLSCRVLCDQFTWNSILACLWLTFVLALRVEIWFVSMWRFFVLCDLRLCTNVMNASLVITFECPVLGRVVDKWTRITCSSGYPSLRQPLVCLRRGCLMPLIAPSLDEVFRGCFALDFSPFLPFRWLVLPF